MHTDENYYEVHFCFEIALDSWWIYDIQNVDIKFYLT